MSRTISISTGAFDGYDLETALAEIAGLGLAHVELAFIEGYMRPFGEDFFTPANSAHLRRLMDRYGLSCLAFSSHINLGATGAVKILTGRMMFARSLGARIIITNAAPKEQEAHFIENIRHLAREARSLGLTIALENPGDGQDNVFNTGADGARLIDRIGSEEVRINYDFGNLVSHRFQKVRPEEDYLPAAPVTSHYHLQDVACTGQGGRFTEIGRGQIDYGRILEGLSALEEPIPLSLEIPLRIIRGLDALPIRAAEPVELKKIRETLKRSLAFVRANLSDSGSKEDGR